MRQGNISETLGDFIRNFKRNIVVGFSEASEIYPQNGIKNNLLCAVLMKIYLNNVFQF